VSGWLEKALREAKRRSSWVLPDEAYEGAAQAVLAGSLDPSRPVAGDIAAFAGRIAAAGAIAGLSQAVLRMTSPGIPDLYQGTEFWDFSLVDPDNRRPVDFDARTRALDAGESPRSVLAQWRDGRVKLSVIAAVLALRGRAPGLFTAGDYVPLRVDGPQAEHIFAFARVHEGRAAIVAVTRCATGLALDGDQPVVQGTEWDATAVHVPRSLIGRRGSNVLVSDWSRELTARIAASDLLGSLPVAVLEVT
jgi:(1->4)-alpha-D-glucan 1-alpha-D-glucosylmutase